MLLLTTVTLTLAIAALTFLLLHFLYMRSLVLLGDGRPLCVPHDKHPGLVRLYFLAAMQRLYMRKGVFHPLIAGEVMTSDKDDVTVRMRSDVIGVFRPPPEEGVVVSNFRIDKVGLDLFCRAVGYRGRAGDVPPTFLNAFVTKPILLLGTSDHGRTPMLGTMHLYQSVTIYRLDCVREFSLKKVERNKLEQKCAICTIKGYCRLHSFTVN